MKPAWRRLSVRGGALALLAAFFIGSALLRAAEIGPAVFSEGARLIAAAQAETAQAADAPAEEAEPVAPDYLMAALSEREAELDERARALEERARDLAIAEAEVKENLAALAEAEASLRETLALADGAAAADLERLTRVYETMKPREAAALFAEMDPNFAAGFLAQMRPDVAGAILEGLPADTAYTVSLVLAGRNMRVPTE